VIHTSDRNVDMHTLSEDWLFEYRQTKETDRKIGKTLPSWAAEVKETTAALVAAVTVGDAVKGVARTTLAWTPQPGRACAMLLEQTFLTMGRRLLLIKCEPLGRRLPTTSELLMPKISAMSCRINRLWSLISPPILLPYSNETRHVKLLSELAN
jgi:hypothetical protein